MVDEDDAAAVEVTTIAAISSRERGMRVRGVMLEVVVGGGAEIPATAAA